MYKRTQESPLRKSIDRIDSLSSSVSKGQSQNYTPQKNTVSIQSRPISAQRNSQKILYQPSTVNGYQTPLRNSGCASGQKTNQVIKCNNYNNLSGPQKSDYNTTAQSKNQTFIHHKVGNSNNNSQTRLSHSAKKNRNNLNNSTNGTQNYSSVMDMSPSRRGIQQTTQSVLYHTNISGTHVKYTENAIDKTQISKLGLKLQPICTIDGHDRSKITYVCTDLLCMNQQKFGCAHCFLDDHGEHAIRKLRIEEFVNCIETKHQQYIESVCNLANLASMMENPTFLKEILSQLDRLKEEFIQRVDVMKYQVENHIRSEIYADNSIIENEVDKQQIYLQSLKKAMQKNVFEMTDEEFGYALNIYHDTFAIDLMKRTSVIQDRYNQLEKKYSLSFQQMQRELNVELDKILSTYVNFETPLEEDQIITQSQIQKNSFCSPVDVREKNQESSEQRLSDQQTKNSSVYVSRNQSPISGKEQQQIVEQNTSYSRKNTESNETQQKQKESEDDKLNKLLAKKESHENILKSNVKIIEELQTIKRDINYLSAKNNFPYTVFDECCSHTIKCNTVPIFECCKQSFQCILCHDMQANHKHVMTNPSKRYCIRCFKIFNVKYLTNIAINCKDCLTVKIKK